MHIRHVSLLCFCFVHFRICTPLSGDPTLTPETVKDTAGNMADSSSNITWSGLPPGESYQSPMTYDARGLDLYYDLVKGFLLTVQPHALPYDLVQDLLSGSFDISEDYLQIVHYGIGFGVCFVIGILFVIILPIVGCCFCCCRTCCNKCGGKMLQKYSKNNKCKKRVYSISLLLCTALIATGSAAMYVTNDVMTDSLGGMSTNVKASLSDVSTFIDNMVDDINYVALTGFNFTSGVLSRDLNCLGYLLGIPARKELGDVIGLSDTLNSIENFESVMNNVGSALIQVNFSIVTLKENGAILQANLTTLAEMVDEAKNNASCDNCSDTSTLKMDVNFTRLPDISKEMKSLEDAQSQGLSAGVQEGKKQFDDIPWTVQNETAKMSESITKMIHDVYKEIESGLGSLSDVQNMTSGLISPVSDTVDSYLGSYVLDYNNYRWYACVSLASIAAVIAVFQLTGILCGVLGTCTPRKPTQRTCVANTGGNFLMAATGFIFIFGSLLTLLLSILFLMGGNMEAVICRTLNDPEYKIVELLEGDNGIIMSGGYIIPNALFGDASIQLPLTTVLKACDANKPAMEALQLYRKYNINDMLDWRKNVDIDSEIDKLDIDLSDVNIVTNDTKNQLNDFKEAVMIDYDGFVDELTKNTTTVNLTEYESKLRLLNDSYPGAGFGDAADYLARLLAKDGIYEEVNKHQAKLLQDIETLNETTCEIPATVEKLLADVTQTQRALQDNATDVVKKVARTFQVRIEGVIDSFVGYANTSIYEDIGKCKPLINVYDSVIDVTFCQSVIATFNGFWYGLGMCVFFMVVSLIFNVKLAKHFRRMKYIEEMDDVDVEPVAYSPSNGKAPLMHGGKVSPQWQY